MVNRKTFGWKIFEARRSKGLRQQEVCVMLQKQSIAIDRYLYSKIEVNRVDVRGQEYDSFVEAIASVLEMDLSQLQLLRNQFELSKDDPSSPSISCYIKEKKQ